MNLSEAKSEFSDQAHTTSVVCSLKNKGYADFTFHLRRKNDIPFIVELKKDDTPEKALKQIKEKEYLERFRKENKDKKC